MTDADAIATHRGDRGFFRPWLLERSAESETPAGWRDTIAALTEERELGTNFNYVILDGDDVVGHVGVRDIVRGAAEVGTIGYWVAPASNGRGLATAAVREMCEIAFGELDLHRLEAATQIPNVGSQRVLERNGFQRIGIAPSYLWIGGGWKDHILWQRVTDRR